jgi:hypothetical protein
MRSALSGSPSLLLHPTSACPRCDGRRIKALTDGVDRSFTWQECLDCKHLWAIPREWTPRPAPPAPPLHWGQK